MEQDTGTAHAVHEGGVHEGGVHGAAFDAGAVSRWIAASVQTFEVNRSAIDAINVFPVADSDTGTNLLHTLRGCARACDALPADAELATVLDAAAGAAVTSARGNSGMIVSQLLRGVADELRDAATVGPLELATALVAAARSATAAVAEPAEGTMLSVLRAAATAAAAAAARGGELASVGSAARDAAETALDRTPDELDVLARAGVVDAGGHGIVLLLAELTAAVGGTRERGIRDGGVGQVPATRPAGQAPGYGERRQYGYEVMYRLGSAREDADRDAVPALRAALGSIGDCVSVVSDGSGNWRVHVHCDDIGAAVEAGIAAGTPGEIAVTGLPGGQDERRDAASREFVPGFTAARAVVAVVSGERLARLFRAEGAVVVEAADAAATGTGPETVYAAIRASRAAAVTVVPQWQELLGVCARAAELADAEPPEEWQGERAGGLQRRVVVVPAASPAQALAAIAVHDPGRRAADDDVAMAEAAAATRRAALVVTDQEALTWAGRCEPGDVLGMIDGEVVFVEHGPPTFAHAVLLVDRLLAAGGELLTALSGTEALDGLAACLRAHLRENHPEVELMTYDAGVPGTVLALGAE